MDRRRVLIVARTTLIAAGLTVLTLTAIRPDNSGATAWAVLATCTAAVAAAWFVEARRARQPATGGRARLAARAALAAAAIVGGANLAFLAAFAIGYAEITPWKVDVLPYSDPVALDLALKFGVIVGAAAGFALWTALRPARFDERPRPRLRRFGPLAALLPFASMLLWYMELLAIGK